MACSPNCLFQLLIDWASSSVLLPHLLQKARGRVQREHFPPSMPPHGERGRGNVLLSYSHIQRASSPAPPPTGSSLICSPSEVLGLSPVCCRWWGQGQLSCSCTSRASSPACHHVNHMADKEGWSQHSHFHAILVDSPAHLPRRSNQLC